MKKKCKDCGETEENHFKGTMLMNIKGCSTFKEKVGDDLK